MRLLGLACLFLLFSYCTKKETSTSFSLTDLELQILDSIHHHDGVFAVAFQNLDSIHEAIFINKSTVFHAASTMKTPVMIEVFKQANAGSFNLTDSLLVTNQFQSIVDNSTYELDISDDSEPHLYNSIGNSLSITQLLEAMITESSNLANNLLIDQVGAANISRTMVDLGAGNMKVLRGVEDAKAFEQGLNNSTDAYSLMLIFQKLANGEVVSPEASKAMIDILKRQQFSDVIPALLPDEVVIAHKTGSISGVHHDSGIVFLPDGRSYVLVLLSKELQDYESGTRLLQNISKMVYDYMASNG